MIFAFWSSKAGHRNLENSILSNDLQGGANIHPAGALLQGAVLQGKISDFRVLELGGWPLKRRKLHLKPYFTGRVRGA